MVGGFYVWLLLCWKFLQKSGIILLSFAKRFCPVASAVGSFFIHLHDSPVQVNNHEEIFSKKGNKLLVLAGIYWIILNRHIKA